MNQLIAVRPADRADACADRWLVRMEPRPTAPLRLYCFPWSGATASVYRAWGSTLPDAIETVAVQLPGRSHRRDETSVDRLAPLAHEVAYAIEADLDERPARFALFGHSFGALLGYEVARRLASAGRYPDLAVLSASRAPARPPRIVLHRLADADLLAALERMGGTTSARLNDQSFLDYFLPLVRADLTACETFRPALDTRLPFPVSVWAGSEDWYAHPEDVSRWHQVAGAGYRSRLFDGGHFFNSDLDAVSTAIIEDLEWSRRCGSAH
jgi:medium-chain acyl-[acyl-carrier-protein] hydrolase